MTERSLAHSAHQSTTEDLEHVSGIAARVLRGRQLFEERWNEIAHVAGDEWIVPSGNQVTGTYVVKIGDSPSCECEDHTYRRVTCYHLVAAQIADSKSRTCDCCGARVLGMFLSEVTEDDKLLSWFVGDELCGDCVRAGYCA